MWISPLVLYCITCRQNWYDMKRLLMKIMLGVVFCFAMMSCSLTELGIAQNDEYDGVWTGPSVSPPTSSESVTYVSAFDYPLGYDWRADPDRGVVKCSLIVYKEGVPILKVPVGDKYCVSPDPDMHRIIDGHLYTDYSTDASTIIKKDGKQLTEYPCPEMISDFQVINGQVHTLGHSRRGAGFAYRINGEPVLERDSGYSFERIFIEDSTVFIPFSEQIFSSNGAIERYYVWSNGKVSQVALRDDVKKVWDVAICDGEVMCLASLVGVSAPVIITDSGMMALSMPSSLQLLSCRMNVLSDAIYVEGILTDGKQVQSVLWDPDLWYTLFQKGLTFSAICKGDGSLHCTLNPASGVDTGLIYRCGETLAMPRGYACMSRNAMDFSSGMLSIGLSSESGGKPVLWVDGQTKELDVNGYISSVVSEQQ